MKIVLSLAVAAGLALGIVVSPGTADQFAPRLDVGTGETLLVLVAGEFESRTQAEAANARFSFADLQGFVVAPTGWFAAMKPGRFALVSAFRTVAGADAFEALAQSAGATSIRRVVTRYTGSAWIGLGQEEHPNGRGPLIGPLPHGHPARIR